MVFIVDKKVKTMNASTLLPNYPTCVIDSESNRAVVVYGLSLTVISTEFRGDMLTFLYTQATAKFSVMPPEKHRCYTNMYN